MHCILLIFKTLQQRRNKKSDFPVFTLKDWSLNYGWMCIQTILQRNSHISCQIVFLRRKTYPFITIENIAYHACSDQMNTVVNKTLPTFKLCYEMLFLISDIRYITLTLNIQPINEYPTSQSRSLLTSKCLSTDYLLALHNLWLLEIIPQLEDHTEIASKAGKKFWVIILKDNLS